MGEGEGHTKQPAPITKIIQIIRKSQFRQQADALAFRIFETAVVTLYWAFAPVIAYVNDRSRELFKRNSQIRKEAKQEASRRAREEGRAAESERIRSELAAKGIIIPPEVADSVFNHRNGHEN